MIVSPASGPPLLRSNWPLPLTRNRWPCASAMMPAADSHSPPPQASGVSQYTMVRARVAAEKPITQPWYGMSPQNEPKPAYTVPFTSVSAIRCCSSAAANDTDPFTEPNPVPATEPETTVDGTVSLPV